MPVWIASDGEGVSFALPFSYGITYDSYRSAVVNFDVALTYYGICRTVAFHTIGSWSAIRYLPYRVIGRGGNSGAIPPNVTRCRKWSTAGSCLDGKTCLRLPAINRRGF